MKKFFCIITVVMIVCIVSLSIKVNQLQKDIRNQSAEHVQTVSRLANRIDRLTHPEMMQKRTFEYLMGDKLSE